MLEVAEAIVEAGGKTLTTCYQCGTCTGSCPWGLFMGLRVREMIRKAQFGYEGFESEDLWKCVTCNTCVSRCPRGVEIVDLIRAMRSIMAEMGSIPKSMKSAAASVKSNGNPWAGEREIRGDWAKDLQLKSLTSDTEYMYFPCCTLCYDSRAKNVARSVVRLLNAANVDFGILPDEETCCGDPSHAIGDYGQFQAQVSANSKLFKEHGVRKIITSSPHCYYTFKNYYSDVSGLEVYHHSEILAELLASGALNLKNAIDMKVTYHDACYLGRHSGIYDPPRDALRSTPGVELIEMERTREESLCCGGGGAGVWYEVKKGERFAELRIEEALATGSSVLAVTCPFCIIMLEDAAKTLNKEAEIAIKDIAEIIVQAL
jgi:Fe-S oxidoreductase